ncbi:MAG: DUF255 domain-containing protein [Sedimentisphaerales bacterium]|nr:DUF255 domain-containing protein [Sedimentisphaerales bacterium]
MVSMKLKKTPRSNRISSAFLIIILFTGIAFAGKQLGQESPDSAGKNLKWSTSYQDSLEQAKTKEQPVLIKFEAAWCVWCEKMEKDVFTDTEVMKELEKFVCVKIDVDKQDNIARAYKIKSLPRTIVINTHNEIVGDWLGFHEAAAFSKLLRDVDEYTHTQTGTTSAPTIQEQTDTSVESQNIPQIDPNNTDDLIGLLGYKNTGVNSRVIGFLVKAGSEILPGVVPALESKYLGTRIAAWKVVRELTGDKYKFDPWASTSERVQAAKIIKEKLQSTEK